MEKTKKKSDVVPLPAQKPLHRLREIRMLCEAVALSRALSLADSLKVQSIGQAAHRTIQATIGSQLDDLAGQRKAISKDIVDVLQAHDLAGEALEKEYQKECAKNEKLREIQKAENELWKQTSQAEVRPHTIDLDDLQLDENGKLAMPDTVPVAYRELALDIDPYSALMRLVEDEILILA